MSLLEKIDSPADLKKLSRKELPDLADEIRSTIVEVVSRTGGHLASSLGAVELAIAIHYVFETPSISLVSKDMQEEYIQFFREESQHKMEKFVMTLKNR